MTTLNLPSKCQQLQLENITTLDAQSQLKERSEATGQRCTNYGVIPPPLDGEYSVGGGRHAHFIGRHCESIVNSYLLSQGFNVAEPQVDHGCDLLFKMGGEWKTGQVKKVIYKSKNNGLKYFNFFFNNGRRKELGYDVDYFFHVITTQHRQLLFMTPDLAVPRTEIGQQVMAKDLVLDRYNRIQSKEKKLNVLDYLVYSFYSPEIIKTYPDFPY